MQLGGDSGGDNDDIHSGGGYNVTNRVMVIDNGDFGSSHGDEGSAVVVLMAEFRKDLS